MKKLIVLVVCIGSFLILSSQQVKNENPYSFKSGWYVGANGGYNIFLGEGNNFFNPLLKNNKPYVFNLKDNGSFLGRLVAGYDFTPVFGLRGMLGFVNTSWPNATINNLYVFSSENLTADAVFNLSNLNQGYNLKRKFDFSVFGGLGMGYRNTLDFVGITPSITPFSLILRGGLQGDYHLNSFLNLNLMLEANLTTDNYNDLALSPLPFDAFPALTVGLTYRLHECPKKMATSVETPIEPIKPAVTEKPAVHENKAITPNIQPTNVEKPVVAETKPSAPTTKPITIEKPVIAETKPLVQTVQPKTEPVVEPAQIAKQEPKTSPVTEPVKTIIPEPVATKLNPALQSTELWVNIFYSINQQEIAKDKQKEQIAKVVDYLAANPNANIIVSGYADKSTGKAGINNWVSKKRAENVTALLTSKYSIAPSRIKTKWHGDKVQVFKQDNMNRLTTVNTEGAQPFKKLNRLAIEETKDSEDSNHTSIKVNVLFDESKPDQLSDKQANEIMKVALFLRKNPQAKICISGYAGKSEGTPEITTTLSKKRATKIANTLILKYSISYDRIQTKWFGSQKHPLGKTSDNRVVVIETIK